jgi:multiple sugar transport system substrate-binding protein
MDRSRLARPLVASALISGLVLTASGCAASTPSADTPAAADTKATITYAIWDETQKEGIEANIDSFNELYPNITVNLTVTPWEDYWTKLQTQASSDTLPDLFWLNSGYFLVYVNADKLASIEPLITDGSIDLSNYPAALVAPYNDDGVQYGVPKDFDTFGIWYNPALFQEAGVAEPTDDWTWADFTEAAQQLRSALKPEGAYGIVSEMTAFSSLYNTIWQAGGDVLSADGKSSEIDSPATVKAIEFWQGLLADDSMPSPQQLSDTSALDWFGSGKAAMYISGSYDRTAIVDSSLGDAVQAAPLPQGEERATITGGLTVAASAKGKNLAATRAFQAYLASQEAQDEQGALGSIIPAFQGTQQGWIDTMPDTNLSVFIDAVDYGHADPVNLSSAEWGAQIDELFVKAMNGELTAQDAAKQMGEAMTTAMNASQ